MLAAHHREIITETCKRYGTTKILLFGSATRTEDPRDIDIAVDGVQPARFFKLHGELMRLLNRPVDLVDLSTRSPFTELVFEEGIPIHDLDQEETTD